jgi:5'-nucleotidase
MRKPRILLTNDDGIEAPGLTALQKALSSVAEVTVVAPEDEQSGSAHSLTVEDPLRLSPVKRGGKLFGYSLNGTPADCVKLAVKALLKRPPDLVVSGINYGHNTGTNVLYSGTVAGAIEAAILGLPALAVSLERKGRPHFEIAARFARKTALCILKNGLPLGALLNVNVPNRPVKGIRGVRVTHQGVFKYTDSYERRRDPRGREYFWLTAETLELKEAAGSDMRALQQGYISVTPLQYDMTRYPLLDKIRKWAL